MSVTERESDLLAQAAAQVISGWLEYQLDTKGRLVLPPQWRTALGLPFALVPAEDGSLRAIRGADWKRLVDLNPAWNYALSGSVVITALCPTTGRFQIPWALRCHAGLQAMRSVALIGLGDSFRIADAEQWHLEKRRRERAMQQGYALPLEVRSCR